MTNGGWFNGQFFFNGFDILINGRLFPRLGSWYIGGYPFIMSGHSGYPLLQTQNLSLYCYSYCSFYCVTIFTSHFKPWLLHHFSYIHFTYQFWKPQGMSYPNLFLTFGIGSKIVFWKHIFWLLLACCSPARGPTELGHSLIVLLR